MIITIIILGYVLSVFFNRWCNKILYKNYKAEIVVLVWLIPLFLPFITLIIVILYSNFAKSNWFTGKNW